jgi:hypothetical protein
MRPVVLSRVAMLIIILTTDWQAVTGINSLPALAPCPLYFIVVFPVSLSSEKRGFLMFTVKQIWIGLAVLLLVMVLVVVSTAFWSHITGLYSLPLLGPPIPQGC